MGGTIMFIDAITQGLQLGNWTPLEIKLKIIGIIWVAVFIAMVIDFFVGVRKSKRNGMFSGSEGFRRSIPKFLQYFGALTFGLLFDIIVSIYGVHVPTGTGAIALILIGIEFYSSFYENADYKLQKRIRKEARTAATLLRHRDDILNGVASVIDDKFSETKQTTNSYNSTNSNNTNIIHNGTNNDPEGNTEQ